MKKMIIAAFAGLALAGCASSMNLDFATDSAARMFSTSHGKIQKMSQDPYTIKMGSFYDGRTPDQFSAIVDDGIIFEYRPEKLIQDVSVFVPSVMSGALAFGEAKDLEYFADVKLTKMRTFIETGSIFRGAYGGYVVDISADVLLRDANSNVLVKHPIDVRMTEYRRAVDGGHPPERMDKKAMRKLISDAVKEVSVRTGWMAHNALVFKESQKWDR